MIGAALGTDPTISLGREWLLTNGLGGFAMGTALGANTRRYHGLLVAAMRPPRGRVLVLHSLLEQILVHGEAIDLAAHPFGDEAALHPDGWRRLVAFDVAPPASAAWTWRVGDLEIVRRLHLEAGANRVRISYEVHGATSPVRLRVRPLVPVRGFHELRRASGDPPVEEAADGAILIGAGDIRARLEAGPGGGWRREPQWWYDFAYPEERARGQDWREDVFSPGVLEFDADDGAPVPALLVEAVGGPASAREERERERAPALIEPKSADGGAAGRLHTAAGQFVVGWAAEGHAGGTSIIAGYPWFADWGRDAMISLPGLLLTTGRFAEARAVLLAFARVLRGGLLPNCFHDSEPPGYNTVDAALWFVHAAWSYATASGDEDLGELTEACRAIVSAYRRGTEFQIGLASDGLIVVGDPDVPLTWMDAKREGQIFTPRDGKPVEINALWHNALHCLAALTTDAAEAGELRERAGHTALSMQMSFWWPERACLYDVLPADGSPPEHGALRPNQIFAASLPHSPITRDQRACVVDAVRDHLLTPYGLRTLEPSDPGYCPRYEGDLMQRDAAYHNGTVWPWLIGPYCEAVLRLHDFGADAKREVKDALAPLLGGLDEGCIGQIAEVYDADPPHRASGCPAQAWSVGEVLRVLEMVGGG